MTNTESNSRRTIALVGVIVLCLAGAAGLYWYLSSPAQVPQPVADRASEIEKAQQQAAAEAAKQNSPPAEIQRPKTKGMVQAPGK